MAQATIDVGFEQDVMTAVGDYAAILHCQIRNEAFDPVSDIRLRTIAIMACKLFAEADRRPWYSHFEEGLAEHGIQLRTEQISPAQWRKHVRRAHMHLDISKSEQALHGHDLLRAIMYGESGEHIIS